MQTVLYIPDNTDCTVLLYPQNPDKYRGNIVCDICAEKSWFVSGFTTEKYVRAPCFAAHHKENCGNKVTLVPDDSGEPATGDPRTIHIDLDKHRKQVIDVVKMSSPPSGESSWGATRKYSSAGDYPENKTLRQILTNLWRNSNYPDEAVVVKMVADGGRIVLEGSLTENLISQGGIKNAPVGVPKIFWGRINNVNRRNGILWLNCGNYRTEPSIVIDDEELERDLISDFRLEDVEDLQGADFIVVGWLSLTPGGKPFIKFGFTKYIAFRKYTVLIDGDYDGR